MSSIGARITTGMTVTPVSRYWRKFWLLYQRKITSGTIILHLLTFTYEIVAITWSCTICNYCGRGLNSFKYFINIGVTLLRLIFSKRVLLDRSLPLAFVHAI